MGMGMGMGMVVVAEQDRRRTFGYKRQNKTQKSDMDAGMTVEGGLVTRNKNNRGTQTSNHQAGCNQHNETGRN
jgi:hypothetical protein